MAQLQAGLGGTPESTLRAAVGGLCELGALERVKIGASPRSPATVATALGMELLVLADVLERWLTRAPGGPIALEDARAREAVKALEGGWSSALVRQLAARPATLTELDAAIPEVSYPTLERRVAWMREIGLIETRERESRAIPYRATDWLREAIAPLGVAGRIERRHLVAQTPAIGAVEVESAFLLTLPLVRLRSPANGTCLLAVHTGSGAELSARERLAGVTVEVEWGRVASYRPDLVESPPTWTVGSAEAWLDGVIDGDLEGLRFGGVQKRLAAALVRGIHTALFPGT